MNKLISGKDALIALANGEKVLIRSHHWDNFDDLTQDFSLNVFFMDEYEFKLKPRTITLNGIEVPCVRMIAHSGGNCVKIACHSIEDAAAMNEALRSIFK